MFIKVFYYEKWLYVKNFDKTKDEVYINYTNPLNLDKLDADSIIYVIEPLDYEFEIEE